MHDCHEIRAASDELGIYVYQAFCEEIATEAVHLNRFGPRFRLDRMSWIKPSFGWMLYRSHYATLKNQERILRITLDRAGFESILAAAVGSSFDPRLDGAVDRWKAAIQESDVRFQWDPDRDLRLEKLNRRAIQLGLRGRILHDYTQLWTVRITDVTELAHAIRDAVQSRPNKLPTVPTERLYKISDSLRRNLGMTT